MFLSNRVRWRMLGNWRLYAEAVIYINIAPLFSIRNACITPRSKCEKTAPERGDTTGVHSVRCTSAFVKILGSDRCEILGLIRKYQKPHNIFVKRVFINTHCFGAEDQRRVLKYPGHVGHSQHTSRRILKGLSDIQRQWCNRDV